MKYRVVEKIRDDGKVYYQVQHKSSAWWLFDSWTDIVGRYSILWEAINVKNDFEMNGTAVIQRVFK